MDAPVCRDLECRPLEVRWLDTLVGTSIGGYTLIKLLGVGGMGSVYLANDQTIGQQVAVKVIRTDLDAYTDSLSAQTALGRFRQEARAVAMLDHLHILPLYRYGEEETPEGLRAYMIMQYRPEGSLWDWLRRRADQTLGLAVSPQAGFPADLPTIWPLSVEEVAIYVQQASSALHYAHSRGVVHRAIKPANFLLRVDAQMKTVHLLLSDFGLAKVFTGSSATNTILGTPIYMAPEQFEGAARPESDQYALAVMIYYLLAGRTPFEGDVMQLLHQHLSAEVPPLMNFNPTVAPAINAVLLRALAKQPEQRFPSMVAFAETFAEAVRSQQIVRMLPGARPADVSRSFHTSDYVSPTILDDEPVVVRPGLLGGGVPRQPFILPATPSSGARNAPSTPGAYNVAPPAQTVYSPHPYQSSPPLTQRNPVGNAYRTPEPFVAPPPYPAGPNTTPGFRSTALPNSGYGRVPAPGQGQRVSRRGVLGWMVGGAALVLAAGGTGAYFYLKNRLPANALFVLKGHTAAVTSLSWLPDGTHLASGSLDASVRLWSAVDGSALQTLTPGTGVRSLAWSPDASKLAAGQDNHSLSLWDATGTSIGSYTSVSWIESIKGLAWQSDSSLLYLGVYGEGLHAFNVTTQAHAGTDTPGLRVTGISLAPGGRYMAVALESGIVYLADLNTRWKDAHNFANGYGAALSIAWSPDGKYLAVGYASNVAVVYDSVARTAAYTLTHNASVYSLAWSAVTGTSVLASGAGDGTVNIWTLDTGKQNQIVYTGHSAAVLALAWSNSVLASASKDQTVTLWQPPANA